MKLKNSWQRNFVCLALAALLALAGTHLHAEAGKLIELENQYLKYVIGGDGSNAAFFDKQSGTDFTDHKAGAKFARVRKSGKQFVVIASGGGNKYNETFADELIAFALP